MWPSTSQPAGWVWKSNNSGKVTFNFTCWLWAFGTQVTQQGPWARAVVLSAHLCPKSFFLDEISMPLLNNSTSLWSQEPTHFLSSVMDMLQWFFLFSSFFFFSFSLLFINSSLHWPILPAYLAPPLLQASTPLLFSFTAEVLIMFDPDAGKDRGQEEKGATQNEMVGGHHWLNGLEFG